MKFSPEINKYLTDEAFSSGLDIPFNADKYPETNRIEKIIELTKNKRVIHVGCADHLPLIPEKIKNNKWLHGLLCKNAEKCIGVDINKPAIDYIRNELKLEDVYCLNILDDNIPGINDESKYDFMILGEIIEHIDNPVAFLFEINKRFKEKVNKIIITAPNVYNILTIKDIKNNVENINTDHRYWFSPFTLTKITMRSGFHNCELTFTERVKLPFFYALYRRIRRLLGLSMKFKANCFANLIIVADFK